MNINKLLKLTAIIGGGLLLVAGIVIGITGYWPIARVGSSLITYNVFKVNFTILDHYYRSTIKITGQSDIVVEAKEVQQDLQRAAMEGLIEGMLIDEELSKRYSASDLTQLIENKIGGISLESPDMEKAMELMYGLTPVQFRDLVLVPKAKREILEGNISLQNDTFTNWINKEKASVRVTLFVPSLYWTSDGVQVK